MMINPFAPRAVEIECVGDSRLWDGSGRWVPETHGCIRAIHEAVARNLETMGGTDVQWSCNERECRASTIIVLTGWRAARYRLRKRITRWLA